MSIQKSLRLSLVLMACLPLIFLTIFTYNLSYKKYMDLATQSTVELAKNYGMGFQSQLNSQIAEVEGLANGTNIQNLVLENYNGVTLGNDSPYYTNVTDLFATASDYAGNNVNYYLYDVNGYYITSSDNTNTDDWQEHMAIPVEDITETKILQCSPLDEIESIDVVSPIIIKSQIVGLIRANITSRYFGSFIPEDGSAFIMTNDGGYLFTSTGLTGQRELETQAFNCLNGADNAKDYGHLKASSFKNIYGFCKLSDSNWLYLIKQQGTQYQQILATLPITMSITLIIILMIAIWVSRILSAKYTEPIFTLRDNMTDASSGNLEVKCDVASDDEFGDLSRMFNSMMDIISNNYKELSASKAALEVSEQELKKNYAHIEQLAYHDGLTGLYNRVAFMKYAYKIFHDASVGASKHAIFFIDLDNFKNINDTLGHDYGDLLLKDVSDRMLSCIASDDILARNGGDEFLILKNRFDTVDDLENFASQLVNVVHHPFILNDETAVVSMSVGIAVFPNNGLTVSELIKNADIAMYNAKNSGKNSYRFFDSYMEDDVNRKNDLADILSHVIDKNEIYLQYQPQVNVESGQVTGYEALMRPRLTSLETPLEVLSLAKSQGKLYQIERLTWFLALKSFTGFKNIPPDCRLFINSIANQGLSESDEKALEAQYGPYLGSLVVELTEEEERVESYTRKKISFLKRHGGQVALDDFGAGYNGEVSLLAVRPDFIKVDLSIVRNCHQDKNRQEMISNIISFARKNNSLVIAEGVQSREEMDTVISLGVDYLQGYYVGVPSLTSQPIPDKILKEITSRSR